MAPGSFRTGQVRNWFVWNPCRRGENEMHAFALGFVFLPVALIRQEAVNEVEALCRRRRLSGRPSSAARRRGAPLATGRRDLQN